MNRATAFFLVLLRLAIGWHFLFEGLHKIPPDLFGEPTALAAGEKRFTSEGYFREGTGPLAKFLRKQVGDPDDEALGRLQVQPLPPQQDPATYPARQRVPPLLDAEWKEYVQRFSDHYQLDAPQRAEAQAKLAQAEDSVVAWLTKPDPDDKAKADPNDKTKTIKKTYPSGVVEEKLGTSTRIAEYKAAVEEIRDGLDNKLYLMGRDVEGKRLGQAKVEASQLRSALLNELEAEHTKKLQDMLDGILTPEQKAMKAPPAAEPRRLLIWLNWLTVWGLRAMGACLLLGLLTRTNCVLAAGFLLMTYLCTPPFPWLPVPPNNEGYYAFVNKNLVEMLALLALATTASGRWFGLDALLHELVLIVRRKPRARPAA